jgi:hypothetical protein
MSRLTEAAQLIRRAAALLDQEAAAHPVTWRRFETRLNDAGADRLEEIAIEIEVVAMAQESARLCQ